MSFNHQYPYTDLSELNLDYILRETKNTRDLVDEANANANSAKQTADNIASQLNQAVTDAADAKSTANAAEYLAGVATTNANQASQTALAAQETADGALDAAEAAQATANNALSQIKKLYRHKLSFNVDNSYYPNITKSYVFLEVINDRAEPYTLTEIESGQIIMSCTGYFSGDWGSNDKVWGSYAEFQTGNLRLWGMIINASDVYNLDIRPLSMDITLGSGLVSDLTDTVTEL